MWNKDLIDNVKTIQSAKEGREKKISERGALDLEDEFNCTKVDDRLRQSWVLISV